MHCCFLFSCHLFNLFGFLVLLLELCASFSTVKSVLGQSGKPSLYFELMVASKPFLIYLDEKRTENAELQKGSISVL